MTRGFENRTTCCLWEAVPDAEVVILDDVNHNFVIENPDIVARIVRDYLGRLEK